MIHPWQIVLQEPPANKIIVTGLSPVREVCVCNTNTGGEGFPATLWWLGPHLSSATDHNIAWTLFMVKGYRSDLNKTNFLKSNPSLTLNHNKLRDKRPTASAKKKTKQNVNKDVLCTFSLWKTYLFSSSYKILTFNICYRSSTPQYPALHCSRLNLFPASVISWRHTQGQTQMQPSNQKCSIFP